MQACCLIRSAPGYRRDAFISGLRAAGYQVSAEVSPAKNNALLIWNRYGIVDREARRYEAAGGMVFVAENGYLGRDYQGRGCYALSVGLHNGAGYAPTGDEARQAEWGFRPLPWRADGDHVLVLPARGIGVAPVAQPADWLARTLRDLQQRTRRPVRVRLHPGEQGDHRSLYQDLERAWCCVTWGSGAALKALMQGVPVFHGLPHWIGAAAALPLAGGDLEKPFTGDRGPLLRRLAWSMWNLEEIARGDPFRWLNSQSRGSSMVMPPARGFSRSS